jgi:hypothetical protein
MKGMKSPFPGMDPYLERQWGDVHHSMIQYARDMLQPALPADLRARVEERVYLECESELRCVIVPDLHVAEVRSAVEGVAADRERGGTAVAEPVVFEVREEPITEGYIEIRQREGGKVVTIVEFLSPANKLGGAGRQKYLQNQEEALRWNASLVEIDLVRAGQATVALPGQDLLRKYRPDYVACISPGWKRNRREAYPISLRDRLPVLPIPLRENEGRIILDLQELLDHVYQAGRYDDTDYGIELEPPLPAEHAPWVAKLLKLNRDK